MLKNEINQHEIAYVCKGISEIKLHPTYQHTLIIKSTNHQSSHLNAEKRRKKKKLTRKSSIGQSQHAMDVMEDGDKEEEDQANVDVTSCEALLLDEKKREWRNHLHILHYLIFAQIDSGRRWK